MDEKHDQITHLSIVARMGNAGDWSENWQFAMDGSGRDRRLYQRQHPGCL